MSVQWLQVSASGVTEADDEAMVALEMRTHVAKKELEDALILKEKRKAREERALVRTPTKKEEGV